MAGADTVPAGNGSSRARVLLGVTGGIAAYKAVELCRLLQQAGHSVGVIQTRAATEFVGPATFAALTGEAVITGEADQGGTFPHLDAGREADVLVVAPATAASLARMAAGVADDVLVATYLAFDGPVVVAPAMNVRMWNHPATQRAMQHLRADGVFVVEPEEGLLACGDVGAGRLAEVSVIASAVERVLTPQVQDLAGTTIVVTAGGTREPIDSVRHITNRSSGKMGTALAQAAASRGASVRLVVTSGVDAALYDGLSATVVETAADLERELANAMKGADALIMAAAVSDFRPKPVDGKLARGEGMVLELEPVPDLLAGIAARRAAGARLPVLVGFAAEMGGSNRAHEKLARKGIDIIVYNDVSNPAIGFESDDNAVTVIEHGQPEQLIGPAPKSQVAEGILDAVAKLLATAAESPVLQ